MITDLVITLTLLVMRYHYNYNSQAKNSSTIIIRRVGVNGSVSTGLMCIWSKKLQTVGQKLKNLWTTGICHRLTVEQEVMALSPPHIDLGSQG